MKIAIDTNRSASTQEFIQISGLEPVIDLVISVNDVTHPKPHPEGLIKAMKHFDTKPQKTWMLGDTWIDMQAGRNAGISTIGAEFAGNVVDFSKCQPEVTIKLPEELLTIIC